MEITCLGSPCGLQDGDEPAGGGQLTPIASGEGKASHAADDSSRRAPISKPDCAELIQCRELLTASQYDSAAGRNSAGHVRSMALI
jgi:hypothetical protein